MANIPVPLPEDIILVAGTDIALELGAVKDASDVPIDLSSGYTAELIIRQDSFQGAAVATLTEGAGLTLGSTGNITVAFTAAESLALRGLLTIGTYSLNITLTAGPTVRRSHQGSATLSETTIQA